MQFDYDRITKMEEELKMKDYDELLRLREELKKYDLVEFIKNVSALMLFPQNQSKSVIFQGMISTALSIPLDEMKESYSMSIKKFKSFVQRFSNLHRTVYVDPPEFPFVLPVIFYNNYHLFMGANSMSVLNLNIILKVLAFSKNEIGELKYEKIRKEILGFLRLSEQIFKNINVDVNSLKFYSKDEDVFVPNAETLRVYSTFISFSGEKMYNLFGDNYNNHICDFGEVKINEIDEFEHQIFYYKPFIKRGNLYIVVDVTTFLNLLMKTIISFVNEKCSFDIIRRFNICIKETIKEHFSRLGNYAIDSKQFGLELINDENYCELLLSSGNDGIIVNMILFDNGKKYDKTKDYIIPLKRNHISNRITFIKKALLCHNIDEYKITIIVTPISIGRNTGFSLNDCNKNELLLLSNYEIEAISINEEKEDMFFQRYLIARKRLKHYFKNDFSELSIIVFYINNNYSFYVNDKIDSKEAIIGLIGEYSADYILKAYQKEGKHLCLGIKENTMIEVIKLDGNVYFAPRIIFAKSNKSSI